MCTILTCVFLMKLLFICLSAADDPNDHVGTVRLGPAQQRHYRDLLVRNTI